MLSTIGRYLYILPFAIFGILHFINADAMAGFVPSFIPGGVFWVYLTGLAFLAFCVSVVIEKKARLACILLGVMLLIFVLTIHLPAVIGGDMNSMSSLLKDLALAGGAWFLSGSFEEETELDV